MTLNLERRVSALESQRGVGRTFYVWRSENQAEYERRLAEAQTKCGPFDKIMVICWQNREKVPGKSSV